MGDTLMGDYYICDPNDPDDVVEKGCPDSCRGLPIDHCPECGRHIKDFDPSGMEAESAQRWCLRHYPDQEYVRQLKNT